MHSELRNKTLYYFTNTYPFGNSPLWKKNELEVLKQYFGRVVVVPLSGGGDARNLVDGVEYRTPVIDGEYRRADRRILEKLRILGGLIFTPAFRHFIRELFLPEVFLRPAKMKVLLRATYELALFQRNATLKEVFEAATKDNSVLYFYWGIGQVNALLLQHPDRLPLTACRFHGWDLYEERHVSRYIPYRGRLLNILDLILPCSAHGAEYLKSRATSTEGKIFIARLGTTSSGRSMLKADNVLKLVSCSRVVEVKRLDVLCEALKISTIPIRWTHIGDGELMPMVQAYAKQFPPNVEADLKGAVSPLEVSKILRDESFDLFINTSSSEGVPVSIMEAFAAGLPVCATDVGGTSEIVDGSVGWLIPTNVSPEELCLQLKNFYELSGEAKIKLREGAVLRFQDRCDAVKHANELVKLLLEQVA